MLAQRADEFNRPTVATWSGLLNGSALIVFADLLMVPVGLLIVAMLTRWLGPEGYGLFALSASLVATGRMGPRIDPLPSHDSWCRSSS